MRAKYAGEPCRRIGRDERNVQRRKTEQRAYRIPEISSPALAQRQDKQCWGNEPRRLLDCARHTQCDAHRPSAPAADRDHEKRCDHSVGLRGANDAEQSCLRAEREDCWTAQGGRRAPRDDKPREQQRQRRDEYQHPCTEDTEQCRAGRVVEADKQPAGVSSLQSRLGSAIDLLHRRQRREGGEDPGTKRSHRVARTPEGALRGEQVERGVRVGAPEHLLSADHRVRSHVVAADQLLVRLPEARHRLRDGEHPGHRAEDHQQAERATRHGDAGRPRRAQAGNREHRPAAGEQPTEHWIGRYSLLQ
ncbi:MAG: hypothetical protein ACHQ4F_16605 [Candidatus Dormibacteria bacterium]